MATAPEGAAPEEIKSRLDTAKDILSSEASQPKPGQLVDRHGHAHSAHVLQNWSPAMLKIMGIRPARPFCPLVRKRV